MINVILLVKDRPRLTEQAIRSLWDGATHPDGYDLTIVDDVSNQTNTETLIDFLGHGYGPSDLVLPQASIGTGAARNYGVAHVAGRAHGDYLYFSDNDAYFSYGWDTALLRCFEYAETVGFKLLGGYCHPFNYTNQRIKMPRTGYELHTKHALGHLSCLLRWDTWDKYGPLEVTPVGRVNASEDFAFSRKIINDGFKVGCVWPFVVLNCGRTDTFGNKSPGDDALYQVPAGVLVE